MIDLKPPNATLYQLNFLLDMKQTHSALLYHHFYHSIGLKLINHSGKFLTSLKRINY